MGNFSDAFPTKNGKTGHRTFIDITENKTS